MSQCIITNVQANKQMKINIALYIGELVTEQSLVQSNLGASQTGAQSQYVRILMKNTFRFVFV